MKFGPTFCEKCGRIDHTGECEPLTNPFIDGMIRSVDFKYETELDRIRAEARNAALEEAAVWVRDNARGLADHAIAHAIRALKTEEK